MTRPAQAQTRIALYGVQRTKEDPQGSPSETTVIQDNIRHIYDLDFLSNLKWYQKLTFQLQWRTLCDI